MSKVGLIFGLNYKGTVNELGGCIKDATDIQHFLISYKGFKPEDIVFLSDDTSKKPTDAGIRSEINNVIQRVGEKLKTENDIQVFFFYSGHGASVPDRTGDETDRKDETICPLDGGLIIDDDLLKMLVLPLNQLALTNPTKNIRLVTLFDSCHSGTILDLNVVYDQQTFAWVSATRKPIANFAINFHMISLSGCMDGEYSTDLGSLGGALTQTVLSVVNQKPLSSWRNLIASVVLLLKKYRQKPLLTSLQPVDLDYSFFFVQNIARPVAPTVPLVESTPTSTKEVQEIHSTDENDAAVIQTISSIVAQLEGAANETENQDFSANQLNQETEISIPITQPSVAANWKTASKFRIKLESQWDDFSHHIKSDDGKHLVSINLKNSQLIVKTKHSLNN